MTTGQTGRALAPSPPHDESAEASVLGACLLAETWLDKEVVGDLVAEDFYRPRHQLIWRAMQSLRKTNDPIDHLTVHARLDQVGELESAGGKDYIETLVTRIPAIGNTKQYAQIIKDNALMRSLLSAGIEIQRIVQEREALPAEAVELAIQVVGAIGTDAKEKSYGPDDLMDLAVAHFNEKSSEVFPLTLPDLNEACNGGLRRGQVMVLSGYPNEGKSSLAMDFLESAIEGTDRRARIYLTEMTVAELTHRIVARQTTLTVNEVIRANLSLEQHKSLHKMQMPNIEIQPASGWTVDQICNDIMRRRPDIVLIDHFHRIRFTGKNKIEAMDDASAKINSVAKDNMANCVILLVAHLSRPGTEREAVPPRPTGRHLRGTQMLEADADIACMVYRDRDKQTLKKLPESEVYFIRNRGGDPDATTRAKFDWRSLRFNPLGEAKF